MKVYQIVAVTDETVGHGSSATIAVVASKNAYAIDPFPLYTDRALAETAAAEASIGNMELKNPASGSPVCGLIVREPPWDMASLCNPCTSPGVIWTSMESSLRPREARPWAWDWYILTSLFSILSRS